MRRGLCSGWRFFGVKKNVNKSYFYESSLLQSNQLVNGQDTDHTRIGRRAVRAPFSRQKPHFGSAIYRLDLGAICIRSKQETVLRGIKTGLQSRLLRARRRSGGCRR
mmetsp:Transcript_22455/g.36277  ORF Transcript_22455/g.36277 Transcript_22455/m.36277 type:complete len:107 (+) Transcript_22455:1956-2276(+)